MLDFACKRLRIEEVIKCGLGLTRADFTVFELLLKNEDEYTAEKIAKKTKLDITTIQRCVKRLYEKDLLFRHQINLKGGGYVFVYNIKNKQHIKSLIMDIIENWKKKVEVAFEKW